MKAQAYWIITIAIIISSCKKSPQPDYNCQYKSPVSASFVVGESILGKFYETDTIDIRNGVSIRATGNYDTITWTIGDDQRNFLNLRAVDLQFSYADVGKTVVIKAVVKGRNDNNCFPNRKTVDTLEKKFTIIITDSEEAITFALQLTKPKFLGMWNGANTDNISDNFTINITDLGQDPNFSDDTIFYGIRIYNIPKGCGGPRNFAQQNLSGCGGINVSPFYQAYQPEMWGYKGFTLNSDPTLGCCPGVNMFGYVFKGDSIRIDYQIKTTNSKAQTFIGKRV